MKKTIALLLVLLLCLGTGSAFAETGSTRSVSNGATASISSASARES